MQVYPTSTYWSLTLTYVYFSVKLEFLPKQEIIEHNKIHHKNRPHICEHCGETFSRNQQYQVHVQGHFINKMKMQEQNSKSML